uniref:Putative RCD1 n=1 Tax=Oryza minuta TaxID=63629 RepID=G9C380_ORYMI|nr:putative RCD1 [Oryza minuta]
MASPQESNSLCLKRKLVDDCLSKECKSRRIKTEKGPSSDSSAKRCKCCCTRPNLASDCVNYLKSGVPSRVMFYKQGSWHNFPEQIMKSLIEEFRSNKSSVVAVMDDEPVLVDFLSMTLVNLKSRKQRSVAWFDDTWKCFYPSLFFDEEADEVAKVGGDFEGAAQGIMLDKVANSPPEVVKQVVLESSPPVSQKPATADILRKKITSVERGSEGFLFAQDLFLSGMGPFATPNNILHIHRYSPNDITAQCRLQAFEKQMMSTKEERGDANVRYGWLGSRKNDIVRILINGFGSNGKPAEKAGLSAGVYLSPEDRAFSSVGLCDVDEKGVQYMLLCRLILGNMEAVMPGSQDSFPSSDIYDSGVDDCSNPKCYVMWPSHLSTHIRLEYLVSFRLSSKVRNYLLGLKGLWFHPSPKEVAVDISTLVPIMSGTAEGPTSPWISFRVLFAMIQENISSVARELLFHHYEELKENKITREEMVKQMIILVGEKLLLETLKRLHYCPSLWYKSAGEIASSDPVRTAAEDRSLDQTGNCSLTVSVAHGDSHATNAVAENSTSLCTKGCDTPATGTISKGHDSLAPKGVPGTSTSVGPVYGASSSVEPKVRDSPIQTVLSGNIATDCAKRQDPLVSRVAPVVHNGLLRMPSGKSASLAAQVCNSVRPSTGPSSRASTEPTNASKSCGIFAPGIRPKGGESLAPSLALGNSKYAGAEGLNTAPRVTPPGIRPKGGESLVPGLALGNSKCAGAEGLNSAPRVTPLGIRPKGGESLAPSLALGNSKCAGAEGLNSAPRVTPPGIRPKGGESLVPSLALGNPKCAGADGLNSAPRVTPKDKEFLSLSISSQQSPVLNSGKGHDGMSGAACPVHAPGHGNPKALATEARGSLSLSVAPKVHDPPASSKEPKDHASPIAGMVSESQHSQAPSAVTKGYNAPTPSTVLGNSCRGTKLLYLRSQKASIYRAERTVNRQGQTMLAAAMSLGQLIPSSPYQLFERRAVYVTLQFGLPWIKSFVEDEWMK